MEDPGSLWGLAKACARAVVQMVRPRSPWLLVPTLCPAAAEQEPSAHPPEHFPGPASLDCRDAVGQTFVGPDCVIAPNANLGCMCREWPVVSK